MIVGVIDSHWFGKFSSSTSPNYVHYRKKKNGGCENRGKLINSINEIKFINLGTGIGEIGSNLEGEKNIERQTVHTLSCDVEYRLINFAVPHFLFPAKNAIQSKHKPECVTMYLRTAFVK